MSFNMNIKIIDSFRGDYDFLSNFYTCDIEYQGLRFTSVEAAYQAAKCKNPEDMLQFTKLTPASAKKLGHKVQIRPDFEENKVRIMEQLLIQKFSSAKNPILRLKLLNTGLDTTLVEGNTWGDTFWGFCNNQGKNVLGRLLMKIRYDLAAGRLV